MVIKTNPNLDDESEIATKPKRSLNWNSTLLILSLLFSLVAMGMSLYNVHFLSKKFDQKIAALPKSNPTTSNGTPALPMAQFLSELKSTDPMMGDANAPLTIVEFADFQCPYCEKFFTQTQPQIQQQYIDTGKVKFVFYDIAFLGDESTDAAAAAKCAADQGQFWQYHDLLYQNQHGENQGAFSQVNLLSLGKKLKSLNQTDFKTCVTTSVYTQAVKDKTALASKYGVSATPTFFIGSDVIKGAQSFATLKSVIDKNLNQTN